MSTAAKRRIALLVVGLLLGSSLVAFSWLVRGDDDPASGPSSPGSREPTADQVDAPLVDPELGSGAGLARFTEQEITWVPCRGGECARVSVPLDHREPEGETITLTMLKVPGRGADPEPLVVNPGGPGGSAMDYARMATLTLGVTVTREFDVIGLDPRGVGQSTPIDCLTDEQLDVFLAQDPNPETPAEIAASTEQAEKFAAGCRKRSGDLVDHVSTVEAARDMDIVRAVLGQEQLNFFGASYGTKLGATYATLYPEQVGRMVLDGAMDPTVGPVEMAYGQAEGFGRALRAWAADYVQTCEDECPLGSGVDEVLDGVDELFDSIERQPLPASGRELTSGTAFLGIAMPLYNQSYWLMLTDALTQARTGDGTKLLTNADFYASRSPSGYVGNSLEANWAINCVDDSTGLSDEQIRAQLPRFEKAAGRLGRGLAWGMAGCRASDAVASEPPPVVDGAGAGQILVVGTTRDPATPYEWSVALADQLESAVLVTRDGDGHTGFNAGNACVDENVEFYLTEDNLPEDSYEC